MYRYIVLVTCSHYLLLDLEEQCLKDAELARTSQVSSFPLLPDLHPEHSPFLLACSSFLPSSLSSDVTSSRKPSLDEMLLQNASLYQYLPCEIF